MKRFLDPKSDIVFKKIFGEHPELLKSFLNSLLPLPEGQQIESLTYLPPEQTPRIPSLKNTLVDVKCVDQQGKIFIVETQLQWLESFSKRLLFGASQAYVKQLERGESYSSLCPVYGVALINSVFMAKTPQWFHHYKLVNVEQTGAVLEGLELVFVELPKFKAESREEKQLRVLWLRFLKEMNSFGEDVPEELLTDPYVAEAVKLTEEASYSVKELEAYDVYLDAVRTHKTALHDSFHAGMKEGMKEGIQEGLEKGIQEGLEKGIQEGLEKGRLEEKRVLAQKLLASGMEKALVLSLTGLREGDL